MDDSFWERRTTFWKDNEPSPGPVQTGDEANFWKDEEPGRGTRPARVEPRARRRSRRVRVRTNKRLAAVVALASAACIVFVYGLLASDVSRAPDGGRAARATDGTQTDGHAGRASSGPLVNAIPVASLRDEPRDLATTPGAAPGSGAAASQTPGASGSGGATSGTSSGSAATKSTSSPSGATAPAPAPPPAPAPAPPPTTAPPAPPPPPSCTIGLLGTCIAGGGGLLP